MADQKNLDRTAHDDEGIRQAAYGIWEEEGKPDGRARDHWHEAERRHRAADERAGQGDTPQRVPADKAAPSSPATNDQSASGSREPQRKAEQDRQFRKEGKQRQQAEPQPQPGREQTPKLDENGKRVDKRPKLDETREK